MHPSPGSVLLDHWGHPDAPSRASRGCKRGIILRSLSLIQQTVIDYLLEVVLHRLFQGGIGHAQIGLAV